MPSTDTVVHEIPMRWADIDSLRHVNNVVYVDYASEARSLLGDGVADAPVRAVTVRYLRPLFLSSHPVVVASTLDGDTLTQQIRSGTADDAPVVAEVVSELAHMRPIEPAGTSGTVLPLRMRRSDLGAGDAVTMTKLFEVFQEARILWVHGQVGTGSLGMFVVGTVSVESAAAVSWRTEPYEVHARIGRVGAGSITIHSDLVADGVVLARSTSAMVAFDGEKQRSRRLGDAERAAYEALLAT